MKLIDFKCFRDNSFEINNLTILTGANAAGKSSIIQALQILGAALSSGLKSNSSVNISLQDEERGIELESADSIINVYSDSNARIILDGNEFVCGPSDGFDARNLHVERNETGSDDIHLSMVYLSAERTGPRFQVKKTGSLTCGCHGEHTASIIDSRVSSFFKIDNSRRRIGVESNNFQIQLDAWLDFLFPGLSVKVIPSGVNMYQVRIRNSTVNSLATNIGFGVSYVLPILVDCLTADANSWILIENPEAHLHAKAQSNMGCFLSVMAASGLRIIVETHSEHIVNGVRKSIAGKDSLLNPDRVSLYFLSARDNIVNSELIKVDNRGNLSSAPVDFFDQQRQDMRELYYLNMHE